MEIPNIVYLKFYEVLKIEFLKIIVSAIPDFEADGQNRFWFTKKPGSKFDTYFADCFKPFCTNPKHFYYKHLQARGDDNFNPEEKEDLLIGVFKDFLHLQYPRQLNLQIKQGQNKIEQKIIIKKQAAALLQVFIESYAPHLFLYCPQLLVFDRLKEEFSDVAISDSLKEAQQIKRFVNELDTTLEGRNGIEETNIKNVVLKFFGHINRKQYDEAKDLLSSKIDSAFNIKWWSLTVALTHFEFGKILIMDEANEAFCGVFYTEIIHNYSSKRFEEKVQNAHVDEIDVFSQEIKQIKNKMQELGLPYPGRILLRDFFSVKHMQYVYALSKYNIDTLKKVFPEESRVKVRRYQIIKLNRRGDEWKIHLNDPIDTNVPRKLGSYVDATDTLHGM